MIIYLRILGVSMYIISLLRTSEETVSAFEDCPPRQDGLIGHPYTITCVVGIDYVGIYWFEESNEIEPLIRYEDGTKIGRGYQNNEYDIEPDGSLRINDVSEKHQMVYKIVVIDKAFSTHERLVTLITHEETIEEIPYTDSSHQFGVVGKKGIIEFSAPPGFQGIYWYDQSNLRHPFIRYEDGTKLGRGYTDGEYDILPEGSLIIKKVTISHEMIYTVVVIDDSFTQMEHKIMFTAVVYPKESVPHVTNCTLETYCHVYTQDVDSFLCSVLGARPAVTLEWFQLTGANKAVLLQSDNLNTPNYQSTHLYDSSARLSRGTVSSIIPSVLICKATGPAVRPNGTEQTVLVESKQLYEQLENIPLSENVVKVVNLRNISLSCENVTERSLIIWRSGESVEEFQTMIYTFYGNAVEDLESKIRINQIGHLILFDASQLHINKVFVCIAVHSNGSTFGQIHKVQVVENADLNTSTVVTAVTNETSTMSLANITSWSKIEETHTMEELTKEMAEETTKLLKTGAEKETEETPLAGTTVLPSKDASTKYKMTTAIPEKETTVMSTEGQRNSMSILKVVGIITTSIVLVAFVCVILFMLRKRKRDRNNSCGESGNNQKDSAGAPEKVPLNGYGGSTCNDAGGEVQSSA